MTSLDPSRVWGPDYSLVQLHKVVCLVGTYACSYQIDFVADMLFVVKVAPLLASSYTGPLIQRRH